ncbi:MAG: hypothetical protein ACK4IX_01420 [Candidatus Sericytochromatia bacterium]
MLKKLKFSSLIFLTLVISTPVTAKPEATLEETMDWLKEKIDAHSTFSGSCTSNNNVVLEGYIKVKNINNCTLEVEETISKKLGSFNQVKEKTFNLKNINSRKLDITENMLAGCWYDKNNSPYYVTLNSKADSKIDVVFKDYVKDTMKTYSVESETLFFNSKEMAERSVKALKHAISLCNSEPF